MAKLVADLYQRSGWDRKARQGSGLDRKNRPRHAANIDKNLAGLQEYATPSFGGESTRRAKGGRKVQVNG